MFQFLKELFFQNEKLIWQQSSTFVFLFTCFRTSFWASITFTQDKKKSMGKQRYKITAVNTVRSSLAKGLYTISCHY